MLVRIKVTPIFVYFVAGFYLRENECFSRDERCSQDERCSREDEQFSQKDEQSAPPEEKTNAPLKDPIELQLTSHTSINEQPEDPDYGIRPVSVITDVLRDLHTITASITDIGGIEITALRKMALRKIKIVDLCK